MTAFAEHMARVHRYAPAPEDVIPHILIQQRGAMLQRDLARRTAGGQKVPLPTTAEYALICADEPERVLFFADWCAMYIPGAALAHALEILNSSGGE